jgi:hypothetical protein
MVASPCCLTIKNGRDFGAASRYRRAAARSVDRTGENPGSNRNIAAREYAGRYVAIRNDQEAAARGARLRELRWKNSAWLATAETIAGWNGFEIRNAGSGRSPVRKRSG